MAPVALAVTVPVVVEIVAARTTTGDDVDRAGNRDRTRAAIGRAARLHHDEAWLFGPASCS